MNLVITQRAGTNRHGQNIDVLEADYVRYFNSLGVNLYPVSNFTNRVDEFMEGGLFDGLVLSGGGDVSPRLSDMEDVGDLDYSDERDMLCAALVERAMNADKPILGICYGMQFINCHFGGKLVKNIHENESDARKPGKNHEIHLKWAMFGMEGKYTVNHYHNNGVRLSAVPEPLEVFATDSEYDVVEGLIHTGARIMALQWHPERLSPDEEFNKKLISAFLGL